MMICAIVVMYIACLVRLVSRGILANPRFFNAVAL